MFTRTIGRRRGRKGGLIKRLVRDQIRPTRPLDRREAGIVVDGVSIWPAEACTEHGLDQCERVSGRTIAGHFLGTLAAFATIACAAADRLRDAIRML